MIEVPPGWSRRRLGELGQYINGMAFKPTDWTTDGLPIIRIQNLTDRSKPCNRYDGAFKKRYFLKDGDLLISWSASLGAFIWGRGPALLNQHIFRVEVNDELVTRDFLYFTVLNALDRMEEMTHGSTMRHITKKKFEAMEVPVPGLPEQRRVVGRIQEAFSRIGEVRRLRKEMTVQRSALLTSLLGEAERHAGGDLVELGSVLADTRNGLSLRASPSNANGEVLTLSAVRSPVLALTAAKAVDLQDDILDKYNIAAGDVFVSRANTMDLVGLSSLAVSAPEQRLIFPDLLIRCRFIDTVAPRYAAYALRFPSSRIQIRERAVGSSQSMVKISGSRLRTVTIPLPSLEHQIRISDWLDEAWSTVEGLTALTSSPVADPLEAAVLRRAFAGKL